MNSSQLKHLVQDEARRLFAYTQGNQIHMDQHPEPSFEEYETGLFLSQKLTELGIPHEHGLAKTGVKAFIEGKNTKNVIALRADIDCLRGIQDEITGPNRSLRDGFKNACGHSSVSSILLSSLKILHNLREHINGSVTAIFQPGEEVNPGGAIQVIAEGALEKPRVRAILAQHCAPWIESGKVAFRSAAFMCSVDIIHCTINGKGGHGATPHTGIDPILVAAQMMVAAQQIVSRGNATIPSVLTFGKIQSHGGQFNVIPDKCSFEGTFRTMDEGYRAVQRQKIEILLRGVAESMGATVDLKIEEGYPCVFNNPVLTERAKASAIEYLGIDNVLNAEIWPASEDISRYHNALPEGGCFYLLGTGNAEKGITAPLHSAHFQVDPPALEVGSGLLAWLAIKELNTFESIKL